MASAQQGLRRLAGTIGFFLGVVLLGVFVYSSTASAQCGPTGPVSVKNTACGTAALASVTTGARDSAFGYYALHFNTTGNWDTASGAQALEFNTTGYDNTAGGVNALQSNTTGYDNTASGVNALHSNTMGFDNTASGVYALHSNTTGGDNMASGVYALQSNTMGYENTASGVAALQSNTTGYENTASGVAAVLNSTTGNSNIGLGYFAGSNIMAGSNNIEIGSSGTTDESDTIRIGYQGTQTATYIAGISTAQVIGNVVEVDSNGRLGIAMSSARYKRDISDMGGASAGLMKLRPVSFRYKNDPSGTLQYGLVAEEVARVYPELVTRDTDGKLQSVRYLELTALLLNEVQKQANQLQEQTMETWELTQRLETKDQQLAVQQREIDTLMQKDASINALSERLAALERQVQTGTSQGLRSLASK